MFEQEGLEAVFVHVRNLVICTLLIAAGAHAIEHGPSMPATAVFGLESRGYGVAASGLIAILNLLDGFRGVHHAPNSRLARNEGDVRLLEQRIGVDVETWNQRIRRESPADKSELSA